MENKKRALFIDRDGTLIVEPPVDFQVDSLQKLEFIPGVLRNMHFIASTSSVPSGFKAPITTASAPSFRKVRISPHKISISCLV